MKDSISYDSLLASTRAFRSSLDNGHFGLRLIESVHMTVTRPHILFSERTLARVSGGKWSMKMETVPRPGVLQMADGTMVAHPTVAAALRAKIKRGEFL